MDQETNTSAIYKLDGALWDFDSGPMNILNFLDKNTLKLGNKLVYLRITNLPTQYIML